MLRDFTPQDQTAVQRLILAGLRERWGDSFDESYNSDLADITGSYVNDGAQVVVATDGDDVVASGILLDQQDGRGQIVRMSVAASHRRRGLATAVVRELMDRAQRKGFVAVDVRTDTPWTSAVALYWSCGFTEVGRDSTDTLFVLSLTNGST